jgi:hypothetical protein
MVWNWMTTFEIVVDDVNRREKTGANKYSDDYPSPSPMTPTVPVEGKRICK